MDVFVYRESDCISSFSLGCLVGPLLLKNTLFTNPLTDDKHIRACSSVPFNQSDCILLSLIQGILWGG